jgi:MraZ protein
MAAVYGKEIYSVDAKGRIKIPLRMQKYLNNTETEFVVKSSRFQPCLLLYAFSAFQKEHERLNNYDVEENEEEFDKAMTTGDAIEYCEINSHNYIMLSKEVLNHAQIKNEVRFVGLGNKLAIWNPNVYEKYILQAKKKLQQTKKRTSY